MSVTATENNSEGLQSSASVLVVVKDAPIVLAADNDADNDGVSDAEEGTIDSDGDGIADYKDNNEDTSVLPLTADSTQVLQTEPGLKLKVGKTVIASKSVEAEGAAIVVEDLAQFGSDTGNETTNSDDEEFQAVSQIVDFEIEQLPRVGMSVSIVLPLPEGTTIPANAIYRKFDNATGWYNFIPDENNRLASSALVNGVCPEPSSESYVDGLNEGDNCVRVTIQDGGEYDQDGQPNGTVVDPGAIVVMKTAYAKAVVDTYEAVNEGESLTLSAAASEGAELQYEWSQLSGVDVTLVAEGDSVTITAPYVSDDQDIELSLRVFNDNFEDTITLPVTIEQVDSQVTGAISGTALATSGTTVFINALTSTDEQGLPLTFRWQQESGPTVTLENTDEGYIYSWHLLCIKNHK